MQQTAYRNVRENRIRPTGKLRNKYLSHFPVSAPPHTISQHMRIQ